MTNWDGALAKELWKKLHEVRYIKPDVVRDAEDLVSAWKWFREFVNYELDGEFEPSIAAYEDTKEARAEVDEYIARTQQARQKAFDRLRGRHKRLLASPLSRVVDTSADNQEDQ